MSSLITTGLVILSYSVMHRVIGVKNIMPYVVIACLISYAGGMVSGYLKGKDQSMKLTDKQEHDVKQYLQETEQVPEMHYIVNRDFLEKVYNSYDYNLWVFNNAMKELKKAVKKELEPVYKRFLELFKN